MIHRDFRKSRFKRRKTLKKIVLIILPFVAGTLLWGGYGFLAAHPEKREEITFAAARVKNSLAHYLFNAQPVFYYLLVEKNGEDLRLLPDQGMEVFYRDEFVIKKVVSDDLTGRHTSVEVAGLDAGDTYQVLLRGKDLVDKVISARRSAARDDSSSFQINVAYKGNVSASLPLTVRITPQDWLRHARLTDDPRLQIDFFKKALSQNLSDPGIRKALAGLYEKTGMINEAIGQYRLVLAENPGDRSVRRELARLYLSGKNYRRFIEEGQDILKEDPGDHGAKLNMAHAYKSLGNWEKAAGYYLSALEDKNPDPLLHYLLGEAYEKLNKTKEALEQYRLAVKRRPGDLNAMIALADTSLKAESYDEAIKWYKEIIGRNQKQGAVYANLALAYGGKGLLREEIANYRNALRMDPNNYNVRFNLATALEKDKKEKEAAEEYLRLLKEKPKDAEVSERLANLEFKNKRYEQAVRHYEQTVKTSPRKRHLYANLGYSYGELKKFEESARNYELALKHGLQDPQIHYNLAVTYDMLKKKEQAILQYERYAALTPNREVLSLLADHYLKSGKYDQAIKTYLRLVSGEAGEDEDIFFNLGVAYEKKEMYREALNYYEKAFEINPVSERAGKIRQMKVKILEAKHREKTK